MNDLQRNECTICGRANATPANDGTEKALCFFNAVGDEETRIECLEAANAAKSGRHHPDVVERLEKMEAALSMRLDGIEADYRRKLRDSAAVRALQSIVSDAANGGIEHKDPRARYDVALAARQYADALMAALDYGSES